MVVGFDPISYILAKRGLKLPTLKGLIIDADKNWQDYRIMNLGEPISPHDAARRIYVDAATTGLGINYYFLDAADTEVPAYKQLSLTPPELSEVYVETAQNSAGDYEIGSWIAPADSIPVLRLGVYTTHFQAERISGNIDVRFFFRLYERDSGGTETLIAESSLSDLVTDRRDVITSLILTADHEMAEGSRLVLKIYVRFLSSGASTTVRLYYQGAVRSRLATPIAKEILDTIYASIIHASRHADGGADPLPYNSIATTMIKDGAVTSDKVAAKSRYRHAEESAGMAIGASGSPATIVSLAITSGYNNLLPLVVTATPHGVGTSETVTFRVRATLDDGTTVTLASRTTDAGSTMEEVFDITYFDFRVIDDTRRITEIVLTAESSEISTSATATGVISAIENYV